MTLLSAKQASALTVKTREKNERAIQDAIKKSITEEREMAVRERRHEKLRSEILKSAVEGKYSYRVDNALSKIDQILDLGFSIFEYQSDKEQLNRKEERQFEQEFERHLRNFGKHLKLSMKSRALGSNVNEFKDSLFNIALEIKYGDLDINQKIFLSYVAENLNIDVAILEYGELPEVLSRLYDFTCEWSKFYYENLGKSYRRDITPDSIQFNENVQLPPGNFYMIEWSKEMVYSFWEAESIWSAQSMAWLAGEHGQKFLQAINRHVESAIANGQVQVEITYTENLGWWSAQLGQITFKRIPQSKQIEEIFRLHGFKVREEGGSKKIQQIIMWST